MSEHTVSSYDSDLQSVREKIVEMGNIAEKMVGDAIEALTSLDADLADQTVAADPRLDNLQREIEDQVVVTIAKRQPMSVDLRQLVGAMRIAGDLERVGDLAKNIAKRAISISDYGRAPRTAVGLKHMSSVAVAQLKQVLEAYLEVDIDSAREVWTGDAEIDAIEEATFRDLLTHMMEDPREISFCAHLLFCTKNIERIGDHATNIAESVYYISTGEALPIDRPKSLEVNDN